MPALTSVLLLQASAGAGMFLAPWLAGRLPRPERANPDPALRLAAWRRAHGNPEADPRPGETPSDLRLLTPEGKWVGLPALKGKRTVLVFAGDGAG